MSGKVLVLEPYYGGSHKNFLDGLNMIWPGGCDFITLPARKWKWRMRLSGPWLAAELAEMLPDENAESYRCILCSTFVDVASFKGLAPNWLKDLPIYTYFHENQFAYPVQVDDERDFHFALTNITTALASDSLAFNSRYNLDTFLEGCKNLLKKSYDMKLGDIESLIKQKSKIINPGIDFSLIDSCEHNLCSAKKPVVVWNHRWEHDKNPDDFFAALDIVDKGGVDFDLIILGESFRDQPEIFNTAKAKYGERILKFGYADSREEYVSWLKRGDVVISTSGHEFYGISVIEAVRAGCRPLLPNRLSYPELFPDEFLYNDGELVEELRHALSKPRLSPSEIYTLTDRFSWATLHESYIEWLSGK